MNFDEALEKLHEIDRECRYLDQTAAVLQWDQETYLPPQGVADRAEQLAFVRKLVHERFIAPETGRLLKELGSDSQNLRGDESLSPLEGDFCKVMRRRYDKAVKLPADFVSAAARAEGLSQAAWVQARRNNDFAAFLPHLNAMIDFARKKARYWGFGNGLLGDEYDGLLDIYEPGMTARNISALFGPLRDGLISLLKRIAARPQPDVSFLNREYDVAAQIRFNRVLMDRLGFDSSRGRLDVSAHPFTTSLGSDDIRITTRYYPANLLSGLFSVIHESGHALYEMGFPREIRGTCLAEGASMAVHESQSRFWENVAGRNRLFWDGLFPLLRDHFPGPLASVSVEDFYRAVNLVKPSYIRVEADEVSYSLHVILRFELEKQLFSGELEPEKLPETWRKLMKEFLGLEPETDAEGVLQDVHWSMGSFGYFPSYALGNLYGLQFWAKLSADLPQAEQAMGRGDFEEIHRWLRETIYRWGCRLDPPDLLQKVTGEKLSITPFLSYLEKKYTGLYGL
ncbi:MAG: carboxypeptidase M32 [Treponema sp.]|jgi:carboxypeptidase Taq|nr:carboxypeptidase M32 [Treponema sp.]